MLAEKEERAPFDSRTLKLLFSFILVFVMSGQIEAYFIQMRIAKRLIRAHIVF